MFKRIYEIFLNTWASFLKNKIGSSFIKTKKKHEHNMPNVKMYFEGRCTIHTSGLHINARPRRVRFSKSYTICPTRSPGWLLRYPTMTSMFSDNKERISLYLLESLDRNGVMAASVVI